MKKAKFKFEFQNNELKTKIESILQSLVEAKEKVEKLFKNESENSVMTIRETIFAELSNLLQIISGAKVPSSKPANMKSVDIGGISANDVKRWKESITSLEETNKNLLETLEVKERKISELQIIVNKGNLTLKESTADEKSLRIKQMEIDLKRKTDLLSEVKILLKQAADRERQQEEEKETLRKQLKLFNDTKTPPEV